MKVFISYAWTNPEYVSIVLLLAERLMSDGVETITVPVNVGLFNVIPELISLDVIKEVERTPSLVL